MNALRERLFAEHVALDALLDEVIESLSTSGAGSSLWARFVVALVAQIDAEDQLVSSMPYEQGGRVLVQEHRYIRARLSELGAAANRGELRRRTLETFRDVLRAHARNDERILYRWAESGLDEGERARVLDELTRRLHGLSDAAVDAKVAESRPLGK